MPNLRNCPIYLKLLTEGNKLRLMKIKNLLIPLICVTLVPAGLAQTGSKPGVPPPNYNLTSDDPYDLHKVFLHFQPLYADLAAINVTAGFGVEANYFHENTFDLTFTGRTTYGKRFDLSRDAAVKNGINENKATPHFFLELGGTYHIKDKERASTTTVTLFDGALKGSAWAATLPDKLEVEANVREIIGVRLGGIYTATTTDLTRTLELQNSELSTPGIPENLYTNVSAFIVNVGGSMSWFRNFSVEFDAPWSPSGDDLLFTTYVDFLYAPSIRVEELLIQGTSVATDNVKTNPYGFRVGISGKFDRKLGWGYGVETGIRPGLQNTGFFLTAKISFPIFAFKLNNGATTTGSADGN